MTSGTEKLGKFDQIVPGISTAMKEFSWALTRMVGTFNANMVKTMFGLDIISPIKHPMMTIASSLAGSLTSIGSTVGICVVALVMLVRYIASNQLKAAIKVFLTTVAIFVGLVVIADGKTNESLFNKVFEIDQAVNSALVNVNPVFDHNIDTGGGQATPNGKIQNAGSAMASSIFYADVYEPYLLMNYGTSDQNAIRTKGEVPIGKDKFDRIDGLLDHENMDNGDWKKIVKHEDEKLKNKTIHYKNNWLQMLFAFFYFLTNLIQTVVFFLLGLMRLAMALIEVLLIPVLPVLLILALFQVLQGVWGNYAKAFGIAIMAKGLLGFCIIMFASYISLGFNIASKNGNVFDKLLTIFVYVLAPIFVYFYRKIFIEILKGQFSFSDLPQLVTHPAGVAKQLAQKQAEKKQALQKQRAEAKAQAKAKKKAEMEQRQKDGNVNDFRQSKPKTKHSSKRKDFSSRKDQATDSEQSKASTVQPKAHKKDADGKNSATKEAQRAEENEKTANANDQTKGQNGQPNADKHDTDERVEEAKDLGNRRPRNHSQEANGSAANASDESKTAAASDQKSANAHSETGARQPQQNAQRTHTMHARSDKRNDVKAKQPNREKGQPTTSARQQSRTKEPTPVSQTKASAPSAARRQAQQPLIVKTQAPPTPTRSVGPKTTAEKGRPRDKQAKEPLIVHRNDRPQPKTTVRSIRSK